MSFSHRFLLLRQQLMINPAYATTIRQARVVVLALSAFIFNTTEFVPIALLTDIGVSFAMPVEQVGMMVTIYAWLVAILSLPAMLVTAQVPRKRLLLWVFALFILGHVISVMAPSFLLLLVGRAAIALAHAIFWSITASLVVRLAPRGRQTKALGLLAMGGALATVLGLPLGRLIGQWLGWRMTFAAIGFFALLTALLLAWMLPKLPSKNVGSLASLPQLGRNAPLLLMYALTVVTVTAHFSAYSYVEPYLLQINQFSANFATLVLLVFGLSGFVASFLFGHFYERYPRVFLGAALVGLLTALFGVTLVTGSHALWLLLAVAWGGCMTSISLELQFQVLKLAPKATDVAMAIFSGIYNVGIGGGALVGSWVIGAWGLGVVGNVGAIITLVAILLALWGMANHGMLPKKTASTHAKP